MPTDGRGSLPFALWHGESLVAVASLALEASGARLLDFNTSWSFVRDASASLVVHDPSCPGTPIGFLRLLAEEARPDGPVLAGVRPVTDTVKAMHSGVVGATVDRDGLVSLASPVVLPAGVVAALPEWPDLTDLPALVARLADRFGVSFLEAPAAGRRIVDESDLRLLEATS